jgi:hypothetical protein
LLTLPECLLDNNYSINKEIEGRKNSKKAKNKQTMAEEGGEKSSKCENQVLVMDANSQKASFGNRQYRRKVVD